MNCESYKTSFKSILDLPSQLKKRSFPSNNAWMFTLLLRVASLLWFIQRSLLRWRLWPAPHLWCNTTWTMRHIVSDMALLMNTSKANHTHFSLPGVAPGQLEWSFCCSRIAYSCLLHRSDWRAVQEHNTLPRPVELPYNHLVRYLDDTKYDRNGALEYKTSVIDLYFSNNLRHLGMCLVLTVFLMELSTAPCVGWVPLHSSCAGILNDSVKIPDSCRVVALNEQCINAEYMSLNNVVF